MRFALGLLVSCAVGFMACAKEEAGSPSQVTEKPLPDQVISNFSITETTKGKKEWSMVAQKAYVYEKRNVLEAQLIQVTFFDDEGSVRSVLTARDGRLDRNTNDMEARHDVVVTGSDDVVLRTESLTWQSRTRQIVSQDSVTVVKHGDILSGWGFRGDPDLGKFEILRSMKATIKPAKARPEGTGS